MPARPDDAMPPAEGTTARRHRVLDASPACREDEWLWGWDPTPGIVSVWAEPDGRATVWRRDPATGEPVREDERFRP